MKEGWDEDPEARLTAANIACRIDSLATRVLSLDDNIESLDSTVESYTHRTVYISSSFSGQSNTRATPLTRISVDHTPLEAPLNILRSLQAFFRRPSHRSEERRILDASSDSSESSTSSVHRRAHASSFSGQSNARPMLVHQARFSVDNAPSSEAPPNILRNLQAYFHRSGHRYEEERISDASDSGVESSTSSAHKKVRVSSSFSGQSNTHPALTPQAFSVDHTHYSEAPPNTMRNLQSFFIAPALKTKKKGFWIFLILVSNQALCRHIETLQRLVPVLSPGDPTLGLPTHPKQSSLLTTPLLLKLHLLY